MEAVVLFVHLLGGSVAVASGYAAIFAPKGQWLHRKAGTLFVWATLLMGVGIVGLGLLRDKDWFAGFVVAYFVITGLLTVRARDRRMPRLEKFLAGFAFLAATLMFLTGFDAIARGGQKDGVFAPVFFIYGSIILLAAIGDVKVLRSGPLEGNQRLRRHLWRMCWAMFNSTGSFFLVESRVPQLLRPLEIRLTLAFLPLALLFYWMWRKRTRARAVAPLATVALLIVASTARAQSLEQAKGQFARGQLAEAKAALVSLESASKNKAEYWFWRGRVASAMAEGDEAVEHFERAVSLNDTSANFHYWLGAAVRDVTPYAPMFKQPFNAKRMRSEWDRAVELDPGHLDARFGLIQFHAMAPTIMGGSKDDARRNIEEINKRNPMRAALGRATVASGDKDSVAMESAYRAAIAAAPDSSTAYFELATLLVARGKGADAVAAIDRYVKRRPEDKFGLYYLGRITGAAGLELDRGTAALAAFLQSPPTDATYTQVAGAHYWTGRIAEKKGDKATARAQYQLAIKLNPRSAAKRALDTLR
jgi:tetratricopeptide (TPR) repeat protein